MGLPEDSQWPYLVADFDLRHEVLMIRLLFAPVLLLAGADLMAGDPCAPPRAAANPLLGVWATEGAFLIFEEKSLRILMSEPDKPTLIADYSITKDGLVFGIITRERLSAELELPKGRSWTRRFGFESMKTEPCNEEQDITTYCSAEMHQPDHYAETCGEDAKCNDAEPRIDIGMAMKELTHRVGVRVVPLVPIARPAALWGRRTPQKTPKPTPRTASAERVDGDRARGLPAVFTDNVKVFTRSQPVLDRSFYL